MAAHFSAVGFSSFCVSALLLVDVAVVSKVCCQCASCCAGDIWENTVGPGENGGGGGGLCTVVFSRFCDDGPLL
jgi:hypothetical protein